MSITYTEARDAIYGAINTVWVANETAIFGSSRDLRFSTIEYREPVDQSEAWGYCEMLVTNTRQIGMRNDNKRRYETIGVVTVDVTVPRSEVNSATVALSMGNAIKKALERPHSGGVWYKHVTAAPSRQTAGAVVVRVIADFKYTEEGESNG